MERLGCASVDDFGVGLDQPAIRVPDERWVAGRTKQTGNGEVVEADVQDRVEHAGHRNRRARADGHQERPATAAEVSVRGLLEDGHAAPQQLVDFWREPSAVVVIGTAEICREHECRRYRQPTLAHPHQVVGLVADLFDADVADARMTDDRKGERRVRIRGRSVAHRVITSARTRSRS